MHVLALDTTTRDGSVAIVAGDRVLFDKSGDSSRSHAERLPEELLAALGAAGLTMSQIDLFAVASGPGSFTGLRIGIATIQGLALVQGKRVVPVSALLALAHAGSQTLAVGTIVGAWMDAHRGEVYSALYRVQRTEPFGTDRLAELDPPSVGRPTSALRHWRDAGFVPSHVVGDGAVKYRDALPHESTVVSPPRLASIVAHVAIERARSDDTVDPAGVQPLYVRRPDAEIARDAQRR